MKVRSFTKPGPDVTVGDEQSISVKPTKSISNQYNGDYKIRLEKARSVAHTFGLRLVPVSKSNTELQNLERTLYIHAVYGFDTDDRTLFSDLPDYHERIARLELEIAKLIAG